MVRQSVTAAILVRLLPNSHVSLGLTVLHDDGAGAAGPLSTQPLSHCCTRAYR